MHMDSMTHMDLIIKSMCIVIETMYVMFEFKIESAYVMIKSSFWFDE